MDSLRARVRVMPQEPGVYRWKDERGEIIYVGKAKNLRQRLRSYVARKPKVEHFRKRALLERMHDLEVTFTSTEMEALILEMHLIRSLKPRYNVSMTRESHYVFVRISERETFPSVSIVHKKVTDDATYLGPFTNPWTQRRTLELLRMLYGFRTCTMGMEPAARTLFDDRPLTIPLELTFGKRDRRTPCLDYHIKRCIGPCTGDIEPERYRTECIEPVIRFYKGDTSDAAGKMIERMRGATGDQKFERAQDVSDLLSYLDQTKMQKRIFDIHAKSIDVFGFSVDKTRCSVLQSRGGSIAREERLTLEGGTADSDDLLADVLMQFYADTDDVPDSILIPSIPSEAPMLRSWLTQKARHTVSLTAPSRGDGKRLLQLARTNAERMQADTLGANT